MIMRAYPAYDVSKVMLLTPRQCFTLATCYYVSVEEDKIFKMQVSGNYKKEAIRDAERRLQASKEEWGLIKKPKLSEKEFNSISKMLDHTHGAHLARLKREGKVKDDNPKGSS